MTLRYRSYRFPIIFGQTSPTVTASARDHTRSLNVLVCPGMTQEGTGDKRRYSHVEIPEGMWVAWEGSGQRFVSRVFDLSLRGVFIPTPDPPRVGTSIKLVFE